MNNPNELNQLKEHPAPRGLNRPILLIIFNRLDTLNEVFEAIRLARPRNLYVAGDGPRSSEPDDVEKVRIAREIVNRIDWPCETRTLFRNKNLGCKESVSGAITWFFENEECGIILEDDCVPNQDFFRFCDLMLDRYENDSKVAAITGNNFQNGIQRGTGSYYFSKYSHCWGWATWRRSWVLYQDKISFWPQWSKTKSWHETHCDHIERKYWSAIFNKVHRGRIDSWAYPWTASVWYHGGLTITPNSNLVSNIGFRSGATHTLDSSSQLADIPSEPLSKIEHPPAVIRNSEADSFTFENCFGGFMLQKNSALRLGYRAVNLLKRQYYLIIGKKRTSRA
jgi:hypothetical protein